MDDPAKATRRTYDRVASHFLENTRDRSWGAARLAEFASLVAPGALVLDLGAGPGCDSAELATHGLRVVGVDLSLGMLRTGASELPGSRVQADLRALPFRSGCARGLWANASLLHLPPDELGLALAEMNRVCAREAVVHVSVKRGRGSGWETERYGLPRFFQYWSASELDDVLRRAGWRIRGAWEESSRRDDWLIRRLSPA